MVFKEKGGRGMKSLKAIILISMAVIEWILFMDMLIRGLDYFHLLIVPIGIIGMVLLLLDKEQGK